MLRNSVRVLIVFMVICLVACGVSKEDLQAQVKTSMQQKLDSDSTIKDYKLTVESVGLVKSGNGTYEGFAKIIYRGKAHDVQISVKTDKDSMMWNTQQNAFIFVLE
jgi:hypothetical protein